MIAHSNSMRLCFAAFGLLMASSVPAAWQRVDVNADLLAELYGDGAFISEDGRPGFFDDQGIVRSPGCSEGPKPLFGLDGQPLAAAPTPADGAFAFFVETGADQGFAPDLLVYLSGGGACWDAATCVGSALTPGATYFASFAETAQSLDFATADPLGSGAGGVLADRPDNPFAGFAKVYVPYCTGDVHVGSSDTLYTFALPPELGGGLLPWVIRHRGFDNLMVVLKWLQRLQDEGGGPFRKLTLAGSSAGGYGALLNFPVVREAMGEGPDYALVVDSSSGVLTDGFLDLAFGPAGEEGVWNARRNIAEVLQPILDLDASSLWFSAFDTVGRAYRDTRISQSTAAYDLVQAIVLLNMKKVDAGTYNPFEAPDDAEIALTALLDWSPKARAIMLSTALRVPNFRFYLGAGQGHVHLLDPPPEVFPFPTTNYFAENSTRGVYYTDWLDDMLNNPRRLFGTDWRNLSCFPGCLQQ